MKTMYMGCKSCGTKFEWTIVAGEEPTCSRCQVVHGADPRAILGLVAEQRVPGQRDIVSVLRLILDRLDKLEAVPEPMPKRGV